MPRRNQPAKQPKPESKSFSLPKLAERIKAWHIVVAAAFALIGAGWWARARASEFASKAELATVKTDIQVHNEELAGIHQAITDFSGNQKQMMDWVRDIYQHPRK